MSTIHEPDGVAVAVEDALRISVTAAANLGRHLANKRTAALHAAADQSHEAQARLRAQIEIDRLAMHAKLAPVNQQRWWKHAKPDEVLDAWNTAFEWRGLDPQAARVATRIRSEFADRHGIDLHEIERSITSPAVQRDEAAHLPVEVASALRDYQQSRRITHAAGQRSVRHLLATGAPEHVSRVPKPRTMTPSTPEPERGR